MGASYSLNRLVHVASHAARQAGAVLADHVGEPTRVETKRSPVDLVTEIDRASELLLRRLLNRAYPDFGVLGEEQGHTRRGAPYRWIIDPLDGTMNFVHGVPFFGVSIGLEHEGSLLVGVVYDPMRRELFVAARGRGAFLNGRRIRVSRTPRLASGLLATGFSAHMRRAPRQSLRWFATLEAHSHAVRRMGSTVLCLAYVAAGRLDGFYEQELWPWDIAAGILLVREAGGQVSDFRGHDADLARGQLIASNRRIHRELVRHLR